MLPLALSALKNFRLLLASALSGEARVLSQQHHRHSSLAAHGSAILLFLTQPLWEPSTWSPETKPTHSFSESRVQLTSSWKDISPGNTAITRTRATHQPLQCTISITQLHCVHLHSCHCVIIGSILFSPMSWKCVCVWYNLSLLSMLKCVSSLSLQVLSCRSFLVLGISLSPSSLAQLAVFQYLDYPSWRGWFNVSHYCTVSPELLYYAYSLHLINFSSDLFYFFLYWLEFH